MEIRLQKILANAGVASRRKAEELIAAGRVAVNGKIITELGAKASAKDKITVDNKPLKRRPPKKIYIMLHKPEGVVTTVTDPFNRPTVMELIKDISPDDDLRLFPVGRLDFETSGLLLLTNDGEWTNKLTHPKHEVKKTYIATVRGTPTKESLRRFAQGLEIEGQKTAPCEVVLMPTSKGKSNERIAKLSITIKEGRNRQVRKMCDAINHSVISLKRVSIGGVKLGDLKRGAWRHLSAQEVKLCQSSRTWRT